MSLLHDYNVTMYYIPAFLFCVWLGAFLYTISAGLIRIPAVITSLYVISWITPIWWNAGALGAAQGVIFVIYWLTTPMAVCRLLALMVCIMSAGNFLFWIADPSGDMVFYRLSLSNVMFLFICAISGFFGYTTRYYSGNSDNEKPSSGIMHFLQSDIRISSGNLSALREKNPRLFS